MSARRPAGWPGWGVLALALLAGCDDGPLVEGAGSAGPRTDPNPEDPLEFGALPDFRLIDQRGASVTLADLAGRPLVLGALFSTCAGPCPSIARSLARLQDELSGTDVLLVVVSVDPETDTPEVLARYAERVGADPARWIFLTGDPAEVRAFVQQGLFLAVEQSASEGLTHDVRLLAVDRRGHRRGWYTGTDEPQVERLLRRVRYLAAQAAEPR
jgi:cytochrome oxidase Cu insertion factor (SCO1/SenC/PrrC family)